MEVLWTTQARVYQPRSGSLPVIGLIRNTRYGRKRSLARWEPIPPPDQHPVEISPRAPGSARRFSSSARLAIKDAVVSRGQAQAWRPASNSNGSWQNTNAFPGTARTGFTNAPWPCISKVRMGPSLPVRPRQYALPSFSTNAHRGPSFIANTSKGIRPNSLSCHAPAQRLP